MTDVASEKDTRAIAVEAFLFGYPLVLMDLTRAVMTNVAQPQASSAPENQIGQMRAFPDASFTDVVSPNADTLYSISWIDVSDEPMVLAHPDAGERYFLLPMLDGWTNVFASPGTRTTGSGAAVFAIVGPRWSGELPDDVQEIRSPTGMVWMIGRTQTNGKADYDNVHHFQDGITLTPLSAWGSDYSPPADAQVDPDVEMTTPPPDVLEAMDARAFFGRLAALMVDNPPADDDAPALERFAAIGLAPGSFEPAHDLVPARRGVEGRDGQAQGAGARSGPADQRLGGVPRARLVRNRIRQARPRRPSRPGREPRRGRHVPARDDGRRRATPDREQPLRPAL